jgi:hypothetical protein
MGRVHQAIVGISGNFQAMPLRNNTAFALAQ